MFSVVFYDVRTGQTGDMMECLDHMTRSHFKGIMTNIHIECSDKKKKYQAYVFINKSLGDVNSMTEFKYPYLLMADIIITGFKTDDGYINIRIKRNTGKNIDFVSVPVRRMRDYSDYIESLVCRWDFDLITDQTWTDLTEFYLFLSLECQCYIDSLVMGYEVEF